MRVGLVGVGNMGKGIARNVMKKGAPVVHSFSIFDNNCDVNSFYSQNLSSSTLPVSCCGSVADLAASCDVIALSLPSENATREVMFGREGICSRVGSKKVLVVDHSTLPVDFVREINKEAAELKPNVSYIDAPVSGGPQGAENGTLSVMIGGPPEMVESCKPLLRLYSSSVFHFGDVGSGMAAKLVNQALVGIHAQAACEALQLAELNGITRVDELLKLLKVSWGQSKILELVFADYLKGSASWKGSSAPLRNMRKDFHSISDVQQDLGCNEKSINELLNYSRFPLASLSGQAIDRACNSGHDADAFVSLILRQSAKPQA